MKLNRLSGIAAVGIFAVVLAGCACGAKQQAKAPPANANPNAPINAIGTTQLMAAEMVVAEPAAKVGKSQHDVITDEAVSEDDVSVKDQPRRKDHRRGSGFSGWK